MSFDFELILTLAFLITGAFWLYDRLVFAPKRKRLLADMPEEARSALSKAEKERLANTPKFVLEVKSYFGIIAVIFLVRSFVVEPFQIPSGSMLPTLKIGDFILVNKFDYGIRLPVLNTTLIKTTEPKRGDVIVFKYPRDPSINYIKRVVGLPGDHISYHNKILKINGKLISKKFITNLPPSPDQNQEAVSLFKEDLDGTVHDIYNNHYPNPLQGDYVVPKGHYFVMGDNRDNSADSRVWGFVPESDLKGRAFYVWLYWNKFFSLPSFEYNGLIK
ncbi:Signal peptidase I [Marinomonas spartinae]|uniref:Signal peptidase I n=1 Tax=Marinomonas spartinae TaxID=1792290 RepID=A0A1A8T7K6_9GAMM|nr:signal peptidase I [Marinomonas spartinae]SBS27846.1 Signal peptidase I [Marinomonas spartinae]SBS28555.1 Signal peptidase I [Marinomonas spartinae]